MKAKIKFKLPQESKEFERCVRATDLAFILWEMTTNGKKSLIKHQEVSEEYEKGVNAVYEKLYGMLDDYSINLDNLIE
jgi:hypothetical protein